jgi:hypothetical protein
MRGVTTTLHALLNSSLDGSELSPSRYGLFNPEIVGRVDPKADLEVMVKKSVPLM